jgi:NDP-sugar pyrophosphorylase family protein
MKKIDIVIFAGGKGLRIKKYTRKEQKCMLKIKNIPFLKYTINKIPKKIIRKIFIMTSYKNKSIKKNFQNKNIKIINEKNPTGTYGALLKSKKYLRTKSVLVMNGDTYVNINIKNFLNKASGDITLLTKKISNTKRYGLLQFKKGKVISFDEKKISKTGYINLGIALIKNKIIKKYNKNKFSKIEEELFKKTKKFKISVVKTVARFIDIGTYKSLIEAKKFF